MNAKIKVEVEGIVLHVPDPRLMGDKRIFDDKDNMISVDMPEDDRSEEEIKRIVCEYILDKLLGNKMTESCESCRFWKQD